MNRDSFPAGISLGITHGTLECRNIDKTRAFFREVLGVQTVRHVQPAFVTWRSDDPTFLIACVEAGEQTRPQSRDNRWELSLGSADAVHAAHRYITDRQKELGIQQLEPVAEQDGFPWFCLQDLDGNWWGFSNRDLTWFDAKFEQFSKESQSETRHA